jgi:hypothetical protein
VIRLEVFTTRVREKHMLKPMLRILALAIVVSLVGSSVEAQGIRLGVKGGAANSNVAKANDTSAQWGFVGGAYAGLGLGSIIVEPEVLYVQRKATVEGGATLKQNYIDVPVLIGFSFGIMVKPIVYIAPVLSFETSCGLSLDTFTDECTDFSTNSALFSGAIGAALDIGMFNIDVRYNLGFSDIVDGQEGRWNTLMIMGGLGLSLGI